MIEVVTHSGKFHPDELFACVLLDMFTDEKLKFIRTRDEAKLNEYKKSAKYFVIDVGDEYNAGKLNFDHHQASFKDKGAYGDTLSSVGLMWKFISSNPKNVSHISKYVLDQIEYFTVRIDRHDNGVHYFPELDFVTMFNYGDKKQDDNFKDAFKACRKYFKQNIRKWEIEEQQMIDNKEALENAKNRIIYSDKKLSVSEELNRSPNLLLVTERAENEFSIQSLNYGIETDFSVRCPAPLEWAGLSGSEIEKFDPRLVFSHKKRFITIVKGTKEDAIEIAQKIIDNYDRINTLTTEGCDCGL